MSLLTSFSNGRGSGHRQSHVPPVSGSQFTVQAQRSQLPSYPFQPLPDPVGPAPYRKDLSQLLSPGDIQLIQQQGSMVFHTVGDTGDYRGQQKDFVAEMMVQDSDGLPAGKKPAFFYHLGDVVYFAGDIDSYGDNFYETYKDYPGLIVSIPGNHDCQPDDPQDGPVDPNKKPLDGWVQNFMSLDPSQPGSLKTGAGRTQMDLPNVYWTLNTPFATVVGLFSNVGETQGEVRQPQIDWFSGELAAADPNLPLIVAVHHPPYSGDTDHSGSDAIENLLFTAFKNTGKYPHLILSGHVHNYQRFTKKVDVGGGTIEIPCVVAGAGGYTKLGKLQKVAGSYPDPTKPLQIGPDLVLEKYDQDNWGFMRLEVSKDKIIGTYLSAPYVSGSTRAGNVLETFEVDVSSRTVSTL
jgi:hypothetical protein